MVLAGCGSVPIHDQEWCGDLGDQGAYCFHTMTTDERAIVKAAWDQERRHMVCTLADNFADTKATLEKLCQKTKCTYVEKKQLQAFFENLRRVQTAQAAQ